jgi:predicted SAM-dependent methyltransferase
MRERIPWWARIAAKLVLSRLPIDYAQWRKLNVFAHGSMHHADYAVRVFQRHFTRSNVAARTGFVGLEIGPGDSLSSAVIAAAHGAVQTHLVDAGRFATADMSVYLATAQHLRSQGFATPELGNVRNLDDLLGACRATYGTEGLQSLRQIPSASVDFIWSQAVLEHIRRHEFFDFMRETRRILRADGVASHRIDLQDHLGGALNNMRIGSRWWEADWMARSGFYTNRLRMSEIIHLFASAGFSVDVLATDRWEAMPTPRRTFAREFQSFDEHDLLVKGFDVILRPV